jgi:hypothetical protein
MHGITTKINLTILYFVIKEDKKNERNKNLKLIYNTVRLRGSRESVVDVVTRIQAGRQKDRGSIYSMALSLLKSVLTDSEAHPASYSIGAKGFPGR